MWGFMGGGRGALPDKFEEQYHCYSAAMADKAHLEVSRIRGRIIVRLFLSYSRRVVDAESLSCHC